MDNVDIPVFKPALGDDAIRAVSDAFEAGWIGMGATTQRFETAIQQLLQTDRPVVATMTGTAALHLALLLAGVGPGDEVVVPSFNYIADIQAILWCGATPVFCDIDDQTLCLDPDRITELITPRTAAIMTLHFAGVVGQIQNILAIAAEHGLRVVEDATHALGSRAARGRIGSFGDIACFSFDPVKLITCIDGGAVVCRPDEDLQRLHQWRLLGVDRDTSERYRNRRAWDYDVTTIGFRAHMTNINAAIGLSQLARIDEFIAARRRYCQLYDAALRSSEHLDVRDVNWNTVGPFIYTLRVRNHERDAFIRHMRQSGIDCGIHFLPCHSMSLCRHFPRGPLPVTECISSEIVTLPLWSCMHDDTLHRIVNAALSFAPSCVEEVP